MTNQITNYKAWRRLDWTLLILFVVSLLAVNNALTSKGGVENWTNWAWLFVTFWGCIHYWENLFGKRGW